MSKRTTVFGSMAVVPIEVINPETKLNEEGKQLVITDAEGGEQLLYPMGKDLTDDVIRKLRMSNRALADHIEEENKRAQARAMLNGAGPGEETVRQVLKDMKRQN